LVCHFKLLSLNHKSFLRKKTLFGFVINDRFCEAIGSPNCKRVFKTDQHFLFERKKSAMMRNLDDKNDLNSTLECLFVSENYSYLIIRTCFIFTCLKQMICNTAICLALPFFSSHSEVAFFKF
jgi:hypothetical protein